MADMEATCVAASLGAIYDASLLILLTCVAASAGAIYDACSLILLTFVTETIGTFAPTTGLAASSSTSWQTVLGLLIGAPHTNDQWIANLC
jgi:hypothetical protein